MIDSLDSALVVAPHADDETLGCGGLLHRLHRQGTHTKVVVVVMQQDRNDEMMLAAKRLGVDSVEWMFMGARLPYADDRAVDLLDKVLQDYRPDLLALPYSGAGHQEHRATSSIGMSVARPLATLNTRHRPPLVLGYEEVHDSFTTYPLGRPTFYVRLSREDVDAKVEAMACHDSQTGSTLGARSERAIRSLAALRGAQIGAPWAEAYEQLLSVV